MRGQVLELLRKGASPPVQDQKVSELLGKGASPPVQDQRVSVTPLRVTKGGLGWEIVRNGSKSRTASVQSPQIKIKNRFEGLSEETPELVSGGESRSVVVVGDSNIKRIDSFVVPKGVDRSKVSIVSLPGAGVDHVRDRVERRLRLRLRLITPQSANWPVAGETGASNKRGLHCGDKLLSLRIPVPNNSRIKRPIERVCSCSHFNKAL